MNPSKKESRQSRVSSSNRKLSVSPAFTEQFSNFLAQRKPSAQAIKTSKSKIPSASAMDSSKSQVKDFKKKNSLIKRTVTKELLKIPISPKYDLPSMSFVSSTGMLSSIPSPQEGVFAEQKRLLMGVDFVL